MAYNDYLYDAGPSLNPHKNSPLSSAQRHTTPSTKSNSVEPVELVLHANVYYSGYPISRTYKRSPLTMAAIPNETRRQDVLGTMRPSSPPRLFPVRFSAIWHRADRHFLQQTPQPEVALSLEQYLGTGPQTGRGGGPVSDYVAAATTPCSSEQEVSFTA